VVNRVETIKRNHQQSGLHSSWNEGLEEIQNRLLSPKGKNIDIIMELVQALALAQLVKVKLNQSKKRT
jgi:hypothetical protein